MKIIVQKFGGSSLATPDLRRRAADHVIRAKHEGYQPVIVVSAMGRSGDPYATDTLLQLAKNISQRNSLQNLDLLLSCGEVISAVLMAETLRDLGLEALAMTGWQSGIITDDNFANSRVLSVNPEPITEVVKQGIIPVITGFQGVTESGSVTTLGRGGSDTTAAVLGVVLESLWVEIYTDVDGVKTADPRIIPEAQTLSSLTYRELVELAHLGAKVVHPRAVEIAMEEGIPLKVLSTTTDGQGTVIGNGKRGSHGRERVGDRVVTGIAHLSGRSQVKITGKEDFNRGGLALKIFDLLAQNDVSVDLIYLSPELVAFIIDQDKAQVTKEVLAPLELNILVETGFAKVSVVGAGMHGVPGVMARVVGALEASNVPIYQTTDSHANISCLIKEEQLAQAIRALHDAFQLSKGGGIR